MRTSLPALLFACCLALPLIATDIAAAQEADRPGTLQAGAPGEGSRALSAKEVSAIRALDHAAADVLFMQGMIHHHAQALEMTALVPERSARRDVQLLARRIEASQAEEIAMMENWLRAKEEDVPHWSVEHDQHAHQHQAHHHHHHHHVDEHLMPGMLTREQMQELRDATGEEFDRLFLEYMIFHHEGAIIMVDELFSSDGGGQDTSVFQFASHVDSDQRIEIARMRAMLQTSP